MNNDKIYVLVQYAKQMGPDVIFARKLESASPTVRLKSWEEAFSVATSWLTGTLDEPVPLITIYAPRGVVPSEWMNYRWDYSPSGIDILHIGNRLLI